MRIGIIGLPASGKTTVFNASTRGHAVAGGYSGGRGGMNLGVAHVPDPRLDTLTRMYEPRKTVPAEVTYADLPGEPGAETGLFTGKVVNELQKVDALLHVVRAFHDDSVPHTKGSVDPRRDIEQVEFDLLFADIALIDRRIERLTDGLKAARAAERDAMNRDIATLKEIQRDLEKGQPLRARTLSETEQRALRDTFLLSALPLLTVANIGDDGPEQRAKLARDLAELCEGPAAGGALINGKLEMDLAQMPEEEEAEMRAGLEAGEPGLVRMIRLSYSVLGLVSFLTVGEDEVRAWSVPAGTTAVKGAGRVHSDIERGFIRAEVVSYEDLVGHGSIPEARKAGTLRLEGRDYILRDGDVVNFLFSV